MGFWCLLVLVLLLYPFLSLFFYYHTIQSLLAYDTFFGSTSWYRSLNLYILDNYLI